MTKVGECDNTEFSLSLLVKWLMMQMCVCAVYILTFLLQGIEVPLDGLGLWHRRGEERRGELDGWQARKLSAAETK